MIYSLKTSSWECNDIWYFVEVVQVFKMAIRGWVWLISVPVSNCKSALLAEVQLIFSCFRKSEAEGGSLGSDSVHIAQSGRAVGLHRPASG